MLLALTAALALQFNIPAGPASMTLREFSHQSRVDVLFPSDEVNTQITRAVSGILAPKAALMLMIRGTGIEAYFTEHGVVLRYENASAKKAYRPAERPACECIVLAGSVHAPYCDDGEIRIHFREECR